MSLERPWLQSYPQGVPAEIDINEFHSVSSVFDASVAKYRDRPAYSSFGKVLTYGETDALVEQLAPYQLGEQQRIAAHVLHPLGEVAGAVVVAAGLVVVLLEAADVLQFGEAQVSRDFQSQQLVHDVVGLENPLGVIVFTGRDRSASARNPT